MNLAEMLAGVIDPRLEGAACAGMAPLFDHRGDNESPTQFEQRATRAASICATCPVRDACNTVADTIPRNHRSGIWAGQNRTSKDTA